MPTLRDWLKRLPRDEALTFRAGTLLDLLEEDRTEDPPEYLTTKDAARVFGRSRTTWQKWARDGDVWAVEDGIRTEAWQEGEDGPWYLPYAACRAHLDRLQQARTSNRSTLRGPRKRRPRLVGEAP